MNIFRRFLKGKEDQVKDWQDPDREENPMACPEISLEQISPELYAKLLTMATAAGAVFIGSKASISNVEFDWNYDPDSQTLHLTATKKPFYITCAEVVSKIQELAEGAKAAL